MDESQLILISNLFSSSSRDKENGRANDISFLLQLSNLLRAMLEKHFSSVESKSLNEVIKLVNHVARKLELKRDFETFAASQEAKIKN